MSDRRLRRLYRRWQETGEDRDRDRYTRERIRCGDLPPPSPTVERLLLNLEGPTPPERLLATIPLGEDVGELGELEAWALVRGYTATQERTHGGTDVALTKRGCEQAYR